MFTYQGGAEHEMSLSKLMHTHTNVHSCLICIIIQPHFHSQCHVIQGLVVQSHRGCDHLNDIGLVAQLTVSFGMVTVSLAHRHKLSMVVS